MHNNRALSLFTLWAALAAASPAAASALDACLAKADFARVARVLDPQGRIVYARVTEQRNGHIVSAARIAPDGTPLARVFAAAEGSPPAQAFPVSDDRVCAVVNLPESALDAESHVIISTGLNYAAHAEEAGGGEVFLFPKPSAPTRPYQAVHAPKGVLLLDYEVELAFVLLGDVDPMKPPNSSELLANSAFFLSNDVSNREAIIQNAALSGTGTGFAEGKGQPGFFPAGPWMVRGSELWGAMEACGASGLRLQLFVSSEADDGPAPRQSASTERMILQPDALVAHVGHWIESEGLRSSMHFRRPRESERRFYPFAVPSASAEGALRLTAGSIVQTGTPEGVALNAPSPLGVTLRGALHLRGPFAQFLAEERERVAAGGTKYLHPGQRVRARIDGLGEQVFEIGAAGGRAAPHPCNGGTNE